MLYMELGIPSITGLKRSILAGSSREALRTREALHTFQHQLLRNEGHPGKAALKYVVLTLTLASTFNVPK